MRSLLTFFFCVLFLTAGGIGIWWINRTEPKAKREGAVRQSAMLVEVIEARRGNFTPEIVVLGTVTPAREIRVRPLVGGEVVFRDPAFTPGGIVDEKEELLQIDPTDYESALEQRKSELEQAKADLAIEEGRQNVARRDFEMLDENLRPLNRALALREPQLKASRARVKFAEAAVKKADKDVKRTVLKAPFDALVLSRNTDLGTQVDPGDDLGRLVCLDEYWVEATVPQTLLRWIEFPEDEEGQVSTVKIRNRASWPAGKHREGVVHRLVGALDETTRMARVLVVVPDPLAREEGAKGHPKLIIDSVVQARIKGRELTDVIRLTRDNVRAGDTVWTMEEGKLAIRKVTIAFRDEAHAYLSGGLEPGARVVTTNLSTVAEGAPLRIEDTPKEEGSEK